jgi:glycosyltransferase involved in cell wall biosynthesis
MSFYPFSKAKPVEMQKNKIKVLNVLTVMREGGMEKLISSIYKGLAETNDFELSVCTMVDPGENFLMDDFRKIPSEVYVLGLKNHSLKISDYFIIIAKTFKLARYIARNKFDVVHSHDFYAAFVTRIAIILSICIWWYKPKKVFVTLHNLFFWLSKWSFRANRVLSLLTNKVICVSKSVLESSLKHDKIKRDKYIVIYNSIDENIYKPHPEKNSEYRKILGFNEKDFIIGNVATLSFRKGQKYLLEAFAKVSSEYPDAVLAIFGGLRSYETDTQSTIQKIIDEGNISDKVRFFEPRDDIKYIYSIFDLYVMSSITEGLSLAAIEAMLNEKVCIFSGIGPFEELVNDGQNGLIFRSENSNDLAGKMKMVMDDPAGFKNMGKNARSSLLNVFSYSNMIKSYVELYKGSVK